MDADPMPRSTEEVLENLRVLYAQRIRQRARVPDIIIEAYRAAWALFYSWEPAYSRHVLHGLQSPAVEVPTSTFDNSLENQLEDFNSITVDSDPSLTFTVWSANFEHRSRSLEPHCVLLSSPSVTTFAYPKYESCAPATRNIFHGRDQGLLEFIQYADEPGFYSTLYARQHNCFAWQTAWHDVDRESYTLSCGAKQTTPVDRQADRPARRLVPAYCWSISKGYRRVQNTFLSYHRWLLRLAGYVAESVSASTLSGVPSSAHCRSYVATSLIGAQPYLLSNLLSLETHLRKLYVGQGLVYGVPSALSTLCFAAAPIASKACVCFTVCFWPSIYNQIMSELYTQRHPNLP